MWFSGAWFSNRQTSKGKEERTFPAPLKCKLSLSDIYTAVISDFDAWREAPNNLVMTY